MTCPMCGGRVQIKERQAECDATFRKRKCKDCNYVFYTTEIQREDSRKDFERVSNSIKEESKK